MLLKKFQLPLLVSTDEFARRVQEFLVTNPMRRPAGSKKMDYMVMEGDVKGQHEIFRSEPKQRYIIASTSFGSENGLPILLVQPRIAGRAWLGPLLFTGIALLGMLFYHSTLALVALSVWGILPWLLLVIMANRESNKLRNWLENELLKI